jgi:chromosome segregation ATPase
MAEEAKQEKGEIVFFGEVDRHPKGGYSSDYPAWYFPRQLEELKEELRGKEDALDVPGISRRQELRQQVAELKHRIQDIESSKPKLTAKQKDDLAVRARELGDEISRAMPPRSDMMKGLADAHEEVRRMTEPCVKVDAELARACGVPLSKGLATRDGATKVWKIANRALGEASNVERLRRDRLDGQVA